MLPWAMAVAGDPQKGKEAHPAPRADFHFDLLL